MHGLGAPGGEILGHSTRRTAGRYGLLILRDTAQRPFFISPIRPRISSER